MQEKLKIIEKVKNGTTRVALAKELGVSATAVGKVWNNRVQVQELFKSGHNRKRVLTYEDVDRHVLNWFVTMRQNKVPISGQLILKEAEEYAEKKNLTKFMASQGWLEKFKRR